MKEKGKKRGKIKEIKGKEFCIEWLLTETQGSGESG